MKENKRNTAGPGHYYWKWVFKPSREDMFQYIYIFDNTF